MYAHPLWYCTGLSFSSGANRYVSEGNAVLTLWLVVTCAMAAAASACTPKVNLSLRFALLDAGLLGTVAPNRRGRCQNRARYVLSSIPSGNSLTTRTQLPLSVHFGQRHVPQTGSSQVGFGHLFGVPTLQTVHLNGPLGGSRFTS